MANVILQDGYFRPDYKHKETNDVYMLLGVSNLAATKPNWIRMAIYKDEIGNIWSRPHEEFNEKFLKL